MRNIQNPEAGKVLSGQALAIALQNFSAVKQLVATGQSVVISEDGDGNNPLNENSDHPAEAGWSNDSLPNELGRLNPPEDWPKEGKVPDLVINKVTQRDSKGKPIRNFGFLPRYLSSNLPGKKIEAYFHKDSRIRYDDLWARMPSCTPPLTTAVKNHRYNNKRIREVRAPFHVPCFTSRRTTITRTDVEIAATLTREMIRQGTVWPISPRGIQDPSNPTRFLPLNTFLKPSTQFDIGSTKTWKSVYLLSVLNVVAKVRDAPGDYTTLGRKYLPKSWSDRLSGSRAIQDEETNSSDDENKETSDQQTSNQEQSASANAVLTVKRETSTEEGTTSDDQAEEKFTSSPTRSTGVTLMPGEHRVESLNSRGVHNDDVPINNSNRTRLRHQDANSYRNPNTRTGGLNSQALLSSELFEQVARLREDRNTQSRHQQIERLRRLRVIPAPPTHMSRSQDSGSWAYGDYADRVRVQGQRTPSLEPPSHGLPALLGCDEDVRFVNYATGDLEF